MSRRFEIGPILMGIGAIVLLVSLFLEWYGGATAWDAFEVVDVLLAVLALMALVASAGLVAPELAYMDRRWMPALVLAVAVLVAAEIISPPPVVGDADPDVGAWLAFGAALLMLAGALLSLGRVSFALAVEGRDVRHRVAAVDHRQPTTESGAVVAPREDPGATTTATEPLPDAPGAKPATPGRRKR
jgi:hypothetical protein